ncbi:sulfate ABC transporter substrate-binding protein [Shouchella clausii]|jgi:sulfate/thiosulfate transport system substrate-binding protein|uniref:Sulfate ABC transporter substrate-binding protein n=1 Tax=Shouchella clausii (strain KSM-K16) TaxID=66692 RepID=Q5WIP1_SHOC1|nr:MULTISPECIES: sulfate ABC transporter substrate-binding protein [Shouchella]ALA51586.1 Sulfate-binding protein Sbp [Shouchella clausii]MBU3232927.1 sulfate ABC transporter substrate-binding protein [Shouchella clausii]MBU3264613.1 sulfate ABC transporter substrate-binding protein [Shouchella clausii]MBU3508867.1 sulfate ABC transporter substrate-binding protein [Shouchella clausii]MBU3533096.1 sulfate ABC transporter substrate-binding protein [Shouchella clausii]
MKKGYGVSVATVGVLLAACAPSGEETSGEGNSVEILNVSYDPTRELYADVNKAFADHWLEKTGEHVAINTSHGGSGSQARSVLDGLEADVVTLALAYDIDILQERELLDPNWQQQFADQSSPYTSTINFLVRKGNPKQIEDWDDLIRDDVEVVTPNPKTSGGARWNYLAAWGYAEETYGSEEAAQQFVGDLYQNVTALDSGARGATTSFVERGIGDVLLAWENEAILAANELGDSEFDIVTPSMSILTEPPVAIVDKVVDQKGTREVAEAYLQFLYSDEGQELIADHYYRPRNEAVLEEHRDVFPEVELFTIDDKFGGWQEAQDKHFADGGIFDQIYQPN